MDPGNLKTIAELREALRREPLDPALHHRLGSALQDAGEHNRAISAYQKALRLDASNAAVMNDLGTAYYARGDRPSAERWFREALAADPSHYSAYENLGSTLRAQGKLAEARRALQKALWLRITKPFRRTRPAKAASAPPQSEAQRQFVAALTAYSSGKKAEALKGCELALKADGDHAEALHLQGMLLGEERRYDAALAPLRGAIALQPSVAEFHVTLGNVLKSMGERKAAVDSYERAVQLNPASPAAYCNIASVYLEVQDYEAGRHWAALCLEADPQFAQGQLDLGLAEHGLGRYPQAEAALRRALELDPAIVRCHCLLGQALREQGRLEEAEESLRRALAAEPRDPLVHLTASAFYHECRADIAKARQSIARALEIAPQDSRAHFNSSLLDLQEGRFSADTWLRYESRKKSLERDLAYRKIPLPDWDGRPLEAGQLLLYGEQGIGDEIMFASMVPDVLRDAREPVLACDPRLVALFARSFPQARVVPWSRTALADSAEEMKRAQLACPLGSLGRFYRTAPEAFPRTAYLKPDAQKVARWRERLAAHGGPAVGLAWRGGTPNSGRGRRSLSFERLRAAIPASVRLVCLQRDPDEAERAALRAAGVAHWPEALADPDETAALISALDQVVTVCSWIVHLCGALGRPALVAVPLVPEWRYGQSGEAMAWYASVELLRQKAFGDWAPVLEAIGRRVLPGASAPAPALPAETKPYSRSSPSPRYRELQTLYAQLHREGERALGVAAEDTFPGRSLFPHLGRIRRLVEATASRSLLDYGSGKGRQYDPQPIAVRLPEGERRAPSVREFWGVEEIRCYDPGYAPYAELPARAFDGTICTDVLEHCPESDLPWILEEIFSFARRFVFLNVACFPARKHLPNGENAHITVREPAWWSGLAASVASRHPGVTWQLVATEIVGGTARETVFGEAKK